MPGAFALQGKGNFNRVRLRFSAARRRLEAAAMVAALFRGPAATAVTGAREIGCLNRFRPRAQEISGRE
jgi:hypothetical protein